MAKTLAYCVWSLGIIIVARKGHMKRRDLGIAFLIAFCIGQLSLFNDGYAMIIYAIGIEDLYYQARSLRQIGTIIAVSLLIILLARQFIVSKGKPPAATWGITLLCLVFVSFWSMLHWIWFGQIMKEDHAQRMVGMYNIVRADNLKKICSEYAFDNPKYWAMFGTIDSNDYLIQPVCEQVDQGEELPESIARYEGLDKIHKYAISNKAELIHVFTSGIRLTQEELEERQYVSFDSDRLFNPSATGPSNLDFEGNETYVGYYYNGKGRANIIVDMSTTTLDEVRTNNAMQKIMAVFSFMWFGIGSMLIYMHQRIINAKFKLQ